MGRREKVRLRDRELSPEELSGFLLQKIMRDAEAFLGEPVTPQSRLRPALNRTPSCAWAAKDCRASAEARAAISSFACKYTCLRVFPIVSGGSSNN